MFLSSYHHEFFRSYYHWQKWCPCKRSRSKVKVTEVKTHLSPFPDCNSSLEFTYDDEMMQKLDVAEERCSIVFQGHPPNFKVTQLMNRFFTQIGRFRTVTSVWIHQMATKWLTKLEEVPYSLQDHPSNFKFTRDKKSPILTRIERFRTVTPVSIHWWFWNDAQSFS